MEGEYEKILSRIRKLQELSRRGVGGEAENAERMTLELMEKYGISESEVGSEEIKEYLFKFRWIWQLDLLNQLLAIVGGNKGATIWFVQKNGKRLKNARKIKCKPSTWIEAVSKMTILGRDYERQLKRFYLAFLMKNDLLIKNGGDENEKEPTEDEIKEYCEALKLSGGIKRSVMRPLLEED